MFCVSETEASGCVDDSSLCDSEGGTCFYNGLCICKDYYYGDICQTSKLYFMK